jgi:hypothetical protein
MESLPFLMWMREVVCPGRGDRNPHKSSLKKAPQSHEKEFGLWRRRASLCRGVIGEESSTRGRWKEESARSARCGASELTFQSFQEHSNKWSIGCPSLFRKSGSSIYEIVPQAVEKKRVIDEENQSNFPEDAKWASSKRPQPGWPGWMRAKRIVWLIQTLWQWNQRPTSWFYEKTFQYKEKRDWSRPKWRECARERR